MEVSYEVVGGGKLKIWKCVDGLVCMLFGGIQTQFLVLAQQVSFLTSPSFQNPQTGCLHFLR